MATTMGTALWRRFRPMEGNGPTVGRGRSVTYVLPDRVPKLPWCALCEQSPGLRQFMPFAEIRAQGRRRSRHVGQVNRFRDSTGRAMLGSAG
jgi:hypothetical protein